MTELFQHQKEGIAWLKKQKKAILADSMGLGKTKQAIIASGECGDGSTLVVCPASLKINWQREIAMEYPEDVVKIVEGGKSVTDIEDVAWIIINYDILSKHKEWIKEMIDKKEIGTVILDEAHYIKGKSIRAKTTIEIVDGAERLYCLTGTPLLNRPIELFNILRAIKHPLGKTRTFYAKRYCGAYLRVLRNGIRFMDEKGATHIDELRRHLDGYFLRRKKEDVLDLPDKIISTLECEMDKEWQDKYDTAWDAYIQFLTENPEPEKDIDNILMARQLVEIQKLKQVCSHSKTARIAADIENMIEQDEKVIVFTQYTDTVHRLETELTAKKIGWVQLTGENDMNERQEAVDTFQKNPDKKVFIANIKAGGVGITLTAASHVIFADMDWSPEIHAQAEDRAHRIGQKGTVNVYYYVTKGTIEEEIMDMLNEKRRVIRQVLEGDAESVRDNSMKEFVNRVANKRI